MNALMMTKVYGENVTTVFGLTHESKKSTKTAASILIGTPGRFLDFYTLRKPNLSKVHTLILQDQNKRLFEQIDNNFHHEVDEILKLLPNNIQTCIFTEELTPDVQLFKSLHLKNSVDQSM